MVMLIVQLLIGDEKYCIAKRCPHKLVAFAMLLRVEGWG